MIKENKKEWKVPVGDIVIPAKVRYSKEISQSAKLIYGDIRALSFKNGFCNASNEYFGFLYGVDDKTISSWINELAKAGFVRSVILKRFERKLYPALLGGSLKKTTEVSEIPDKPLSDKPDNIDILIDNTIVSEASLTTNFNSKEELLKWKASNQRWLHILGVYGLWRKVDSRLVTKATLNKLLPEFRKVATELADFTDDQLRQAFVKCDEMKDKDGQGFDWTLRTVKKVLLK
jgi:hypothetical protein